MSKPRASDIVMSELLWFGGVQKTRRQIWDELLAEGFERQYVDFYLFSLSQYQASPEQIAEDVKFVRKHEKDAQVRILAVLQCYIQETEATLLHGVNVFAGRHTCKR